jgi:hypothetical protein
MEWTMVLLDVESGFPEARWRWRKLDDQRLTSWRKERCPLIAKKLRQRPSTIQSHLKVYSRRQVELDMWYDVKRIVGQKVEDGQELYEIEWENSWISRQDIDAGLIEEYEQSA